MIDSEYGGNCGPEVNISADASINWMNRLDVQNYKSMSESEFARIVTVKFRIYIRTILGKVKQKQQAMDRFEGTHLKPSSKLFVEKEARELSGAGPL